MSKWAAFKEWDYRNSHRIAHILGYDSKARKAVQAYTLSGTYIFWLIYLLVMYLLYPGYHFMVYAMSIITTIMLVVVFLVKQTVRRKRPDFKDTRFGAVLMDEWSFPSGHASRATYVMWLMPIYMPHWLWFWLVWGLLIILSRLLLGVHYITDIIGGIIFSSFAVWVLYLLNWVEHPPFINLLFTIFG